MTSLPANTAMSSVRRVHCEALMQNKNNVYKQQMYVCVQYHGKPFKVLSKQQWLEESRLFQCHGTHLVQSLPSIEGQLQSHTELAFVYIHIYICEQLLSHFIKEFNEVSVALQCTDACRTAAKDNDCAHTVESKCTAVYSAQSDVSTGVTAPNTHTCINAVTIPPKLTVNTPACKQKRRHSVPVTGREYVHYKGDLSLACPFNNNFAQGWHDNQSPPHGKFAQTSLLLLLSYTLPVQNNLLLKAPHCGTFQRCTTEVGSVRSFVLGEPYIHCDYDILHVQTSQCSCARD